jgi:hypothetical protein
MQRDRGAAVCDGVVGRLRLAGFGAPQFGGLAHNPEGRVDGLIAVVAVVEEVDVAAGEFAMNECDAGVELGLGVIEVRTKVKRGQGRCGVLSGEDFAFAEGVDAGSVAKEFLVEPVELRLVVGEAGVSVGLGPVTMAPCSTRERTARRTDSDMCLL